MDVLLDDPATQLQATVDAALEYLQERVNPNLLALSLQGAHELMDLHYPTKWYGFVHDWLQANKTC